MRKKNVSPERVKQRGKTDVHTFQIIQYGEGVMISALCFWLWFNQFMSSSWKQNPSEKKTQNQTDGFMEKKKFELKFCGSILFRMNWTLHVFFFFLSNRQRCCCRFLLRYCHYPIMPDMPLFIDSLASHSSVHKNQIFHKRFYVCEWVRVRKPCVCRDGFIIFATKIN